MTRSELLDKFKELDAGDFIEYNDICKLIDKTANAEQRNIYTDSVGFLESVELEGQQIAVIDGMNTGGIMVRQVDRNKIKELERG